MAPLPPLRDGGCALPICPFGRACLPLISDAPDCKCSPGRLRFWVVWASCPGAAAPISIHAPRVGRDACDTPLTLHLALFQSTRPVWGATAAMTRSRRDCCYFNPRARVGRDKFDASKQAQRAAFQSTRPVWGATTRSSAACASQRHFNPRAPCGARPYPRADMLPAIAFQSTRPVWGATKQAKIDKTGECNFNPRAPCGARRQQPSSIQDCVYISIHAPRVGRDTAL